MATAGIPIVARLSDITENGPKSIAYQSSNKAIRPLHRDELGPIPAPLVVERGDGSGIALLESDLYSASDFGAMRTQYAKGKETFVSLDFLDPIQSPGN